MKKLFLISIWLLTLVAGKYQAIAQPSISSSSSGDVCPNQNYTYTAQGSTAGCSLTWQVSGGTIVSGQNTGTITVKWNDKLTSSSNVTSVKIDCGGNSSSAPFPVFVSSISDVTPGPLTINGTAVGAQYLLPFGDNTALTLRVPLVELPRSSTGNVPLYAITYDWVLPSGWKYNDGTNYVSDGSTMHRVSGSPQAGNQLSVTPSPGSGGVISVRAVNNNCVGASTGPDNSVSKTANGFVARPTPQLTIISDRSPNGGNFTLTCGDRSDYHFRSISDAVPAGGSFDSYVFTFSGAGIITPTGNVAGPNPVTNFTGSTGRADVSLRARYTRNGASILVGASNISVLVQSPPQPIITSSVASPGPGLYPLLCGSAATLTLSTSVAGATSYTWTATGGLGLNGPGVSTLTTSSSSVTIFPGSGSGEGLVTVSATNGNVANCASATSAGYGVAYGGAYEDGTVLMHADSFNYEGCAYGCNGICPGSRVTMQTRHPAHTTVLEAIWKIYRTDVSPAQLLATQSFSGSSIGSSMADYTFAGAVVGNRYQIELQERNSCGWGNITTHPLEVIDCGGGYEPFFTSPSQPTTESTAYPNPASDDLTLEQGGGPVRLTNAHGHLVRSQTAAPGRLHLDTRSLPAGLYFLETRDSMGKAVRQQIRIER